MNVQMLEELRDLLSFYLIYVAEGADARRARALVRSLEWLIDDIKTGARAEA